MREESMSVKQHYKKLITLASIGVIAFAISEASAQSSPDDFFSGAASTTTTPAKTGNTMPAFNAKRMSSSMGTPSDQLVGKLSAEVFQEMVDLERENAVLALQLKREKLQTDIEELKASQRDQIMEEIERREELARARIEWEKQQEVKVLESRERLERQRIREKQIDAVIARNEEERRIRADEEKRRIEAEQERKLQEHLEQIRKMNEAEAEQRAREASTMAGAVAPFVSSPSADGDQFWGGSQTQPNAGATPAPAGIAAPSGVVANTTVATPANPMTAAPIPSNAVEEKKPEAEVAPVVETTPDTSVVVEVPEDPKASDNYYVIEIRGLGDALVAKLSDKKNTSSFFVRVGSTLGTGHEVTNITGEYVEAKLNGKIDQIQFLSGGVAYRPDNR